MQRGKGGKGTFSEEMAKSMAAEESWPDQGQQIVSIRKQMKWSRRDNMLELEEQQTDMA